MGVGFRIDRLPAMGGDGLIWQSLDSERLVEHITTNDWLNGYAC
ncbi:MAG: hypothetical protein JWR26_1440 [Pedosphaera sp.]|nr:hypothetical protein [Pedosphaera sp.]